MGTNAAVAALLEIFGREDIDVRVIVCDGEPQNLDLMGRLKQEWIPEWYCAPRAHPGLASNRAGRSSTL